MKKLIIAFLLVFIVYPSLAQKQTNFYEKEYLILKDGKYFTDTTDNTVFLKHKKRIGSKLKVKEILVKNGDTTHVYEKVDTFKVDTFKTNDFKGLTTPEFKGDFALNDNVLKFYPWKFTEDENSSLNKQLKEYQFYIDIPYRTVVRVKYKALQYGLLTLPVKYHLFSRSDSLVNNVQTGVNLNLMLGKKWGYKKYRWLPNEKEGTSYETSWSFNIVFGISKIDLSKSNTTPALEEEFSIAALSSGLAFGRQYNKIGAYLVLGIDTPLSKYGTDWDFKNLPWIGLALGLGL